MYGAKGLCADGIEEITLNAHLEPVEIFAIVAIGTAILGFVYSAHSSFPERQTRGLRRVRQPLE